MNMWGFFIFLAFTFNFFAFAQYEEPRPPDDFLPFGSRNIDSILANINFLNIGTEIKCVDTVKAGFICMDVEIAECTKAAWEYNTKLLNHCLSKESPLDTKICKISTFHSSILMTFSYLISACLPLPR